MQKPTNRFNYIRQKNIWKRLPMYISSHQTIFRLCSFYTTNEAQNLTTDVDFRTLGWLSIGVWTILYHLNKIVHHFDWLYPPITSSQHSLTFPSPCIRPPWWHQNSHVKGSGEKQSVVALHHTISAKLCIWEKSFWCKLTPNPPDNLGYLSLVWKDTCWVVTCGCG